MNANKLLKNKAILILITAVFAVIGIWYIFQIQNKASVTISNFEQCVEAGYPIEESYPSRCRTPQGQVFTQDLGNELEKRDLIRVDSPRPNAKIESPLSITGEARGGWYFEANFPIKLTDEKGEVIASGVATAQGEWMTEEFVPFIATVSFSPPISGKGYLILEKSNPSALAENADELRIPVMFAEAEMRAVQLYYYNEVQDPNQECGSDSVKAVSREISVSKSPIGDSITLLLKGELSAEEKENGFSSEFPLEGVELTSVNLREGVLYLEFSDPEVKTTGGSCRVSILRAQIEKTARQFPEVREVRFIPEDLFQP